MRKSFPIAFGLIISILFLSNRIAHTPTPYHFPKLLFFPKMPVSATNTVTEEGAALGRFLFYDPILSKDSTVSCASCHQQKAAFSDAPNAFSTGIFNRKTTRNAMPLFNLAWYPALFWDGRAESLEAQALHPVRTSNEMGLDWQTAIQRIENNPFYVQKFEKAFGKTFGKIRIDSFLIANAIAQFERTLISNNSKYDQVLRGEALFTPKEYQGYVVANEQNKGNCLQCHTTDANALGTTLKFSNNGLDKAATIDDFRDKGKGGITKKSRDFGTFKIPSLRNVAVTPPYMHDGRFKTLEEVIQFYSDGMQSSPTLDPLADMNHRKVAQMTEEEQDALLAFLHTLTDSTFLNNSAFSNPFEK